MDTEKLQRDIESCCKDAGSKLYLFKEPTEDTDDHGSRYMKFTLAGGLNGHGKWKDYFESLKNFTEDMFRKDYDLWLIDMKCDVLDDVFDAYFGVNC